MVVPFGTGFKAKGCTTALAAIARVIVKTPGAYYVAIRGQHEKE